MELDVIFSRELHKKLKERIKGKDQRQGLL